MIESDKPDLEFEEGETDDDLDLDLFLEGADKSTPEEIVVPTPDPPISPDAEHHSPHKDILDEEEEFELVWDADPAPKDSDDSPAGEEETIISSKKGKKSRKSEPLGSYPPPDATKRITNSAPAKKSVEAKESVSAFDSLDLEVPEISAPPSELAQRKSDWSTRRASPQLKDDQFRNDDLPVVRRKSAGQTRTKKEKNPTKSPTPKSRKFSAKELLAKPSPVPKTPSSTADNIPSPSSKKLPIPLILGAASALILLVLGGLIIAQFSGKGKPENKQEKPKSPPPAYVDQGPNPAQSLQKRSELRSSQDDQNPVPPGDLSPEEKQNRTALEKILLPVAKGFFQAASTSEILPHCRHASRVKPLIDDYYQRKLAFSPRQVKTVRLIQMIAIKGEYFWFCEADFDSQETTDFIAQERNGEFKIDWEAVVTYNPMTWKEFVINRPQSPVTMRVVGRIVPEYHYPYIDNSQYMCVEILPFPKHESPVFAYIQRDAPHLDKLRNALTLNRSSDRDKTLMLSLKWRPDIRDKDRLAEIVGFVNDSWIIPES